MKIFFVILIALSSCKSEKNTKPKIFNRIIADSSSFEGVKNNANLLNFYSIENGVDSFELRLWSFLAMTDLRFVTILKSSNSGWSLTETTYWVDYINDNIKSTILRLDSSVTKGKEPGMSFTKVIDSLNRFQIWSLPSQQEIPDFVNRTADGFSYIIEVATKDYYKIISYDNPKHYEDLGHKRINKLLNFLKINLDAFVEN